MTKIEHLELSARTYLVLKRAQIDTVEQLREFTDSELMRIRNMGRKGIEEIREKLAEDINVPTKWVSVQERLPDINQDVLMYFDAGNMAVGFWHDGDETITFWCSYSDDGWYTDCDSEPTHWMPLPEPPKEVE